MFEEGSISGKIAVVTNVVMLLVVCYGLGYSINSTFCWNGIEKESCLRLRSTLYVTIGFASIFTLAGVFMMIHVVIFYGKVFMIPTNESDVVSEASHL